MKRAPRLILTAWLGLIITSGAGRGAEPTSPVPALARTFAIPITIQAGTHDRRDSVVTFLIPPARLAPEVNQALLDRPVGLQVTDRDGPADSHPAPTIAEAQREPGGTIRVVWFLPRPLNAGATAHFEVDGGPGALGASSPWATEVVPGRTLTIRHRPDRLVLRYNLGPTTPPESQGNPALVRDAYIHPAYSPAGALITGDYSAHHPHHRGFFLAYVHTKWGDLAPDFWNIQSKTGRVVAAGNDPPTHGPVAIRFAVRHRWEALRPDGDKLEATVALREGWEVTGYDVPGSPYWLFDLTSTQQAEGHPLEVLPHRYGGMAYRSAEPSVQGPLDVLTAEGRHRLDGDQKPTRWVDLTGPITDGSPNYAGAMIADHPNNLRYPTVVRIHPITLPFYSFVPAHDEPFTIATDRPIQFRYRIMIHDGRPDSALNDRIAADFVDPPVVTLD